MDFAKGEDAQASAGAAADAEQALRLFAQGLSRAATAPLERALAIDPDWTEGWRLLADIRRFSGDHDGARTADDWRLRAAVAGSPALRGAADALVEGRLQEAEHLLVETLKLDPHSTPAAHLLGEVITRRRRLPDAERLLGACVRNAPDFDLARLAYAALLAELGESAAALDQLAPLLARDPESLRGRMIRRDAMAELGDHAGACEAARALLADIPDQPWAWTDFGHRLETVGRFDEAAQAFRRALGLDPAWAQAWWGLAALKACRFSPEDVSAMRALEADRSLEPAALGALKYALGKALEDLGDDEASFACYLEGGRIISGLRPHEPELLSGVLARSKATLTPAFFTQRQDWGFGTEDPVFIVGMPRSGTTLVEQILASHPAIEATRELDEIDLIAKYLGGFDLARHPASLAQVAKDLTEQLGRDYIEWTRPYRRLGRARFIDKAPANFLHVGLIRLILPSARIVEVRRRPMACCVSAFKEHFASGWGVTYDLEALGRFYAQYVELMDHYAAVLPGGVHRVLYEDLVADTEGEVRRLLDHLGLEFDEACLRFFENPKAVTTASASQVRRPIYRDSLEQWRRFEPWLGPLKAGLGPALVP
jgi:predicted Zn-dependent protease